MTANATQGNHRGQPSILTMIMRTIRITNPSIRIGFKSCIAIQLPMPEYNQRPLLLSTTNIDK